MTSPPDDTSGTSGPRALDPVERRLLDDFQRDFPLLARPFAALAERLGTTEEVVIARLRQLEDEGVVSRVGAVLPPHRVGSSTLAALAVPPERLESVAGVVSAFPEVNHNYEREHRYNLWFVITAASEDRVSEVLEEIEARTGLVPLDLPLLEPFHIDLGFPLQWN